jgi:hypothetical protein
MATYAAMRQTFIDLLNRTDSQDPDAALVKGFFDSSIQRTQREVRAPCMEVVATIDTDTAVSALAVPVDWLQSKALVWDDGSDGGEVDEVELGTYYRRKNEVLAVPTMYVRQGPVFLINSAIPAGCEAYLIYYGENAPLVNDTDETILAKVAPDLIIYGALTYAADYYTDDRKDTWEAKWQFFREQIQSQATEGESEGIGCRRAACTWSTTMASKSKLLQSLPGSTERLHSVSRPL